MNYKINVCPLVVVCLLHRLQTTNTDNTYTVYKSTLMYIFLHICICSYDFWATYLVTP